jgi:hypothetical protein
MLYVYIEQNIIFIGVKSIYKGLLPKQHITYKTKKLLNTIKLHVWNACLTNMKQARPWMLTNLKIICWFYAHPVHQNSVNIFGPRYMYVMDDFFRVETSLVQSNSFSLRELVVLESNCTEKDYFCCEEMTENNDKENISRTS